MAIFKVTEHFPGLDYIHEKKRKTDLWRSYEKCLYVSMAIPNLPMDFYCLSESPPYVLSKTMKNTHGILSAFLVIRQQTSNM